MLFLDGDEDLSSIILEDCVSKEEEEYGIVPIPFEKKVAERYFGVR